MEDQSLYGRWCGVVACKDNNKVVRCGVSGVAGQVGCDDRLVFGCGWIKGDLRIERTLTHFLP